MPMARHGAEPRKYRVYTRKDIDSIPQLDRLGPELRLNLKALSTVLPFRVNQYVLDELIRWEDVPDDPIYQLTFLQEAMLDARDLGRMRDLVKRRASSGRIERAAREIQMRLNPHPAGQMAYNVPVLDGEALPGMQHKYRETVLFFPSHGQTCHAYCTYCFRWPQFVGIEDLKFSNREISTLVRYLRSRPEVESVLFTGGDPLIMKASHLRRYLEPLLAPELESIHSIRIGTKATAYWPYRFLTDPDAPELLRLFETVVKAGKHLAIMSHYSHPRELETHAAQAAVRRILRTGAVIRCQAPLVRHVNDDADVWADLWRLQVRLGAVPYYMFVERDTGPKNYFEVPLARAYDIFKTAYRRVSGLARTVRGPSMSATPGKVAIEGVAEVSGEQVFVLKMIQGRDPAWVGRVFFARFDPEASWLSDLVPPRGESEFFYESALGSLRRGDHAHLWRARPVRAPRLYSPAEWE